MKNRRFSQINSDWINSQIIICVNPRFQIDTLIETDFD